MNEKIENLKSAGLIDYWYEKSLNKKAKVKNQESPQKLAVYQLLGSFEVLLIGYSAGLLIFIFELLYVKYFKRRTQK